MKTLSEYNNDGDPVSEGSQVHQNEEQQRQLSEPARICKLHCALFLSKVLIHSKIYFMNLRHAREYVRQIGGFDEVIDVRSPAEFEDDHIPGASEFCHSAIPPYCTRI